MWNTEVLSLYPQLYLKQAIVALVDRFQPSSMQAR